MESDELSDFRESVVERGVWFIEWQIRDLPYLNKRVRILDSYSKQADEKILQQHRNCEVDEEELVENNLLKISPKLLFGVLRRYFSDADAMRAISCFLNTYTAKFSSIFDSFVDNHKVGETSAYGIVFETNLLEKNLLSPLVIKYSKDLRLDDLRHELAVGYVINRIRQEIPNFIYTLGGFNCNQPISEQRDISGLCYKRGEYQHLVLERIIPGQPMGDFIRSNSRADMLNMITQVLLSLDMAYNMFHFVHNDLHLGNILIRDVEQGNVQIQYQKGFLKTNRIATIIDLGLASMVIDGRPYFARGLVNKIPIHIINGFPLGNIIYDINKFLTSIVTELIGFDNEMAMIIYGILGYQSEFHIFRDVVLRRLNWKFHVPMNGNDYNFTQDMFVHSIPYNNQKNYQDLGQIVVNYLRKKFPSEFATFYSETLWPDVLQIPHTVPSKCVRYYFYGQIVDDYYIPTPTQFWYYENISENISKEYLQSVLRNNKLDKNQEKFDMLYMQLRGYVGNSDLAESISVSKKLARAMDYFLHMWDTARAMRNIINKYKIIDKETENKLSLVENSLGKYQELRAIIRNIWQKHPNDKFITRVYDFYNSRENI